jgi:hypothetical protein
MDRVGVHGVTPVKSDGNYTSSNTGTLTNQELRQHDLGRALNRGIMGSGSTGGTHPNITRKNTTIASGQNLAGHGTSHFRISNANQTLHDLGATKPHSSTQGQSQSASIPIGTNTEVSHSLPSAGTKGRQTAPLAAAPPSGIKGRIAQGVEGAKSFRDEALAPDMVSRGIEQIGRNFNIAKPGNAPAATPGPDMPSLEKAKDSRHSIEELLKFLEKEKVK